MIGCPNVNSPEWRALVDAVGEFQAMKDWMQYEDIRTPEDVKFKLLKSKPLETKSGFVQYLEGKLDGSKISNEIEGKLEANKDRLIDLLGQSMYSEKLKDVVYKELLQNAFDATKIAESKGLIKKGKIDIIIDEKERTITFQDNGIGMTPDIVQKAFFTIGGTYKGEDVDNKLKSGGLGLAKMAFIFGSEKLKLETVNNGIKTTVDATSEEIRTDNFKIKTQSTSERNGTKVSVKIPETYVDSKGENRPIDFPKYLDSEFKYSFLANPLIGNVDINYSVVNRTSSYNKEEQIKTNLGNIPEGFVLFSPAKTSFADMDIYIDTKNITRGSYSDTEHKILSSGLFQFDVDFKKDDREKIPLNIIINIKPKVDPTNAQYPFNNQRENFKPTVKNDIGALNKYLALLWQSIEVELLKSSFNKIKNIEAVNVENVDDSIINKNKEITKSFTSLSNSEIIKSVIDDFNKKNQEAIITDGGLKTKELSLTKEDIDKDKEKAYKRTFKAEKEISINKDTGLKLDSNKPIIHNNTNMTLDAKSAKFLSEISSIMLEYKKSIINFYGEKYSDNIKDQLWGVSIDKNYGGVNVNPSFLNMLAINPFYNFPNNPKVDAVNYIAVAIDHLIIHELNHNFVRNEGAEFTGRFLETYSEIHSLPNHFELVSKLKLSIKNNLETVKKLNYEYQQSENVESGFEGNRLEADNKKRADTRAKALSDIDTTIDERTDNYDTGSGEKFGEIVESISPKQPSAQPMKALVPQKVSEPRTLEGKFKKEIGLKNKELSFDQRWRMLGKIRSANAKFGTSFYVKFQQVGQANIFTWKILDYKPGDILTEEEKKQIPPKVAPPITPQSEQKGGDQLSLFYREINSLPTATELMNEQYPADELVADTMSMDNAIATDTLVQYADAISEKLNIPYEIIDEETAKTLTEGTVNQWNGEPAFFYGNKVYFIKERAKLNMVFHEFAHPLIRAVRLQNPQLYKNLLTKLSTTKEGQELMLMVKDKYPELERFTGEMMDEVLVRAVESAAMDIKQSVGFAKFIKDLMFAIRQLLRKVFGQKITVQNLNPDSTFKDLAEMLMPGNQITMDLSKMVTQDDIVNYYKDTTDYLESLEALETIAGKDYKTMQELIDRNAQNIISHLSRLEKRQNLGDILDIFKNEFGENMLAKMKGDLGRYSSLLNQKLANITKDATYMRNASSSLLTTLHNLDVITTKVENHLENMDRKDRSTIYKAAYYKDFLKDWAEFLEEGEDFLSRNKAIVPKTHPLVNMLGRIRSSITNSKKIIQDIDFEGTNQMLRLELQTSMDNIDKRYNEIFEHLKKINAPESQFKKWQAEYDKVKLTPEKIEKTLKGELGDANPLNSFLEGYLYNTDPVIGGFALYVKNNMTDVLVRASAKHNDFVKKLMPLLEDWGKYRPSKEGELGELLGFLDTIGYKDADGKFVTKEIWTLLNNFTGYREVTSKFRYDIEELSKKAIGSNKNEDKLELLAKKREYNKFLIQYMHQKYIPAYYQRLEMLWKDEIGENLEAKMDEIFDQMNALNQPTSSQEDILGTIDKLGKLWRDYSRLSSETDLKGNPKTGMDLLIAKRMQEYKAASKDMYDFVPKDRAFAEAYEAYEQDLINNYARGFKGAQNFVNSLEFQQYMDKFLKKNLRTTIKENFWEDRAKKFEELKVLMAASPVSATLQKELTDAYDEMRNLTKFYKDSDNQIIGSEMAPELQTKITRLEQKIEKIKRDIKKEKKVKGKRLNRVQLNQIRKKLREISDMQTVEATDYYIDAVNEFIADIEPTDLMLNKLGGSQINRETVDEFLRSLDIIDYLKGKSPEFAEWFDRNHIEDVYIKEIAAIDPETGDPVGATEALPMFRRSPAWNVIMPRDSKYYKTFTFVKSDGTPVTVPGEPSLRFYNRVVKPEYHTGYDFNTGRIRLVVGVHVDNKSTEPNLPRMDVADRKFINQRYIDMSKADPSTDDGKLFKILELIKEYHLENQKGLDMSKKLYYDFPRYHKNIVEILQTKDLFQKKWSAMGLAFRRIADFFRKAKDDPDSGLNPEDTWNLVRADMFDDTTAKIPMTGLVGLDAEQTSTNILDSITKYMLAAEKNKKLIEMSPYADAIKSILGDKKQYGVKDLKSINKFNFLYRGLVTFLTKKGESVREKAVNNFIEREFEGVKNTGLLSGNAFANKISQMMFKRASFGFFALNFPSALKNQLGAKFQGLIEAASGKYYNVKHFAAAEGWSLQLMKDISFNIYEKGELPVNIQLFNMFDPSEGRTEEKLGEGMSRTLLRDVANMTWLLNFRKWTELQATAQQFGAMMKGKKVKMNGEDIEYLDAWEVRDGKLQTKAGVDAAWSLTYDDQGNPIIGAEFKNFRNTVQAVIRDLNGAYSEFTQPEAQRYLVFRFFSYLRKFFTTMLISRFGFAGSVLRPLPRLNVGFNDVREGYYITAGKTTMRAVLNIGKMMPYATPDEKRALIKMSSEVAGLVAMSMLLAPLFGWDPDDEDRFEKLREKSGALPFFGLTEEDSYYPFHMSGWLSNQALNLMMQVRAENEQFLPIPGFGLDDYGAFLDIKSIAAGPTLKKYGQIFEDVFLAASEDNRGFYQRDVGPYTWQQEESAKIWNHLFSTFGLTGSSLDPAVAVKNFQGIQARAR